MGTGRTDEFRKEAVRIALTSGLSRRQVADDLGGGIALGLAGGIGLGFGVVKTAVAGSLIVLGAMLAMAQPFPPALALPLVLVAGLVHGLAHGGEIGGTALPTALGMLAGSVLLHAFGAALGVASARYAFVLRFGGAAIAGFGAFLLIS
jgi:urease accessory protein